MEKTRLKSYLTWIVAIFGYYLWFQTFYNAMCQGSIFPYGNLMELATGFSYNFPPILIVFLLNLLIVFRLVRIDNLKIKICADASLSLGFCLIVNWLYLIITGYFRTTHVDWTGTVLNDIIILLGVEIVYYFTNLSESRKEIEQARRQILQYQYDVLKSQINPHFLFNSLNLLHSLVSIDTAISKQFIQELASMYCYIMAKQGCDRVTVAEEFSFLSSYVSVLEMRYNNKFSVEISGTPSEGREMIPFTMPAHRERHQAQYNILQISGDGQDRHWR